MHWTPDDGYIDPAPKGIPFAEWYQQQLDTITPAERAVVSKHRAGRQPPMGQRARRLRARAERQRIRNYLDQQAFEGIIAAIENGELDGPGA
jgi:hypothetical protein